MAERGLAPHVHVLFASFECDLTFKILALERDEILSSALNAVDWNRSCFFFGDGAILQNN